MTSSVTLLGALSAGFISFASPCVLPLVPPYLAFMAGVSLEELRAPGVPGVRVARLHVAGASLGFIAGFTTVFLLLGVSASVIGQIVNFYRAELAVVAGVLIIVMGLHFLGLFRIPLLYREARVRLDATSPGAVGSYVMGLAFGFGWTPCIGPVLSAILTVSASQDTVAEGAALLLVYSLGLGIPFFLTALFTGPFMRLMVRFRRHIVHMEKVMGVALIATGIMFLTGGPSFMSQWLIETFPGLSKLVF